MAPARPPERAACHLSTRNMAVPAPHLPPTENPLRDKALWDVELHTLESQHICHASGTMLAHASPNYLWAHVRARKSGKFDKDASTPLVVGTPGMDPTVVRNLVVWSTQLQDNEKDAWLTAMLPTPPPAEMNEINYTADQWGVLLQYLDAARALQLLDAADAVRRRALRPALQSLIMRPRATLEWNMGRAYTVRPYILSPSQMSTLPRHTDPRCARLAALGVDVCDTPGTGLFLHRVHAESGMVVWNNNKSGVRRGMVLQSIGGVALDGACFAKKLSQARAALPPLQVANSTMFVRRRVEMHIQSRNYIGVRAWAPWPEELLEVHRHLRDLQLEDELQLLAQLLEVHHTQTLKDLRETALTKTNAQAMVDAFQDTVRKDALWGWKLGLPERGSAPQRKRRRTRT